MIPLYFKLGPGEVYWEDKQLGILLEDPDHPADVTDANNLTEDFITSMNANKIVQISEAEYNGVLIAVPTNTPITFTTNYLITIKQTLNVCPANNAVFFLHQGGKWYKIPWAILKGCSTGSTKANELFRVGDEPAPYPQDTDTDWTMPWLIGKQTKNLEFRLDGTEVYPESMYDVAELPDVIYYSLNNVTGTLSLHNAAFATGSFVRLREV